MSEGASEASAAKKRKLGHLDVKWMSNKKK
jgi:hypothetical protein